MLEPLSARAPLAVLVLVALTGFGASVYPHRVDVAWSGRPELVLSADLAARGSIVQTSRGILVTLHMFRNDDNDRYVCGKVVIEGRMTGGTVDSVDVRGIDNWCPRRRNLMKYE